MATGMLCQVVAAHEAFLTERTAELLFSCVSAVMAGQLIGAGKLLITILPAAFKGSFTCRKQTWHD